MQFIEFQIDAKERTETLFTKASSGVLALQIELDVKGEFVSINFDRRAKLYRLMKVKLVTDLCETLMSAFIKDK